MIWDRLNWPHTTDNKCSHRNTQKNEQINHNQNDLTLCIWHFRAVICCCLSRFFLFTLSRGKYRREKSEISDRKSNKNVPRTFRERSPSSSPSIRHAHRVFVLCRWIECYLNLPEILDFGLNEKINWTAILGIHFIQHQIEHIERGMKTGYMVWANRLTICIGTFCARISVTQLQSKITSTCVVIAKHFSFRERKKKKPHVRAYV